MESDPGEQTGSAQIQKWAGIIVALCIIIPPLRHVNDQGWTLANILLVSAGVLLLAHWTLKIIFPGRAIFPGPARRRQNAAKR
ncbi:hypothetical protein CVV68_14150 [Arthrobacter livingstonensis]|uniref:Uncharacterized protein n=1 Tax=Arthrobacter livingstonensis TaxID=670078 RepID=A0A2V5L6X6_9MICC|nr:hypothetical protein CVV68_14150 [Arthrobacter livingstonensis]